MELKLCKNCVYADKPFMIDWHDARCTHPKSERNLIDGKGMLCRLARDITLDGFCGLEGKYYKAR